MLPALPPPPLQEDPPALHFNLSLEIPLALGLTATWILLDRLQPELGAHPCRWCAPGALDSGVRDLLVWKDQNTPDTLSSAITYAGLPLAIVLADAYAVHEAPGASRLQFLEDIAMIVEASVGTGALTSTSKIIAGRQRPSYHYQTGVPDVAGENTSFFSGHTSQSFAGVFATGTVFTLRRYPAAPYVWAAGLALASLSGYFRIAADKHYFTDVVVGAVVGAGLGVAVPLLHRRRGRDRKAITILPQVGGDSIGLAVLGTL